MNRAIYLGTNCEPDDFQYELSCAKEAGFKSIGISFLGSDVIFKNDFSDYMKALREELDRQEIKCVDTHLPVYDILLSSEIVDEKMDKAIKNGLVSTSILGAEWASFHPRTAMNYNYSSKIAFEHNREALKPLLDVAHKYDVGIAVEYIPVFPDVPQYIFYSSNPDDLCEIVDCFDSDKIGVCWDTSHANLMTFDQAEVIRKIGKRLKQTHLGSNYKERDGHTLPVFGNINWENVMKALKDISYSGALTLEVNSVEKRVIPTYMKLAFESVTILKELFEK